MKLHEKIIAQFLRWGYHWAQMLQGAIGILTLGFYSPSIALKAVTYLARYQAHHTKWFDNPDQS